MYPLLRRRGKESPEISEYTWGGSRDSKGNTRGWNQDNRLPLRVFIRRFGGVCNSSRFVEGLSLNNEEIKMRLAHWWSTKGTQKKRNRAQLANISKSRVQGGGKGEAREG